MAQATAKQIIAAGADWIDRNGKAWQRLKWLTRRDVKRGRRELRIAAYVEELRADGVSVPNPIRPYLSRRLEHEVTGAEFTKAQTKIDREMKRLFKGE